MVSSDKNRTVFAAFGQIGGDYGMTKRHIFEQFDGGRGLCHFVDAKRNHRDVEPAGIMRQHFVVDRPYDSNIRILPHGVRVERAIIVPSNQQYFVLWMCTCQLHHKFIVKPFCERPEITDDALSPAYHLPDVLWNILLVPAHREMFYFHAIGDKLQIPRAEAGDLSIEFLGTRDTGDISRL